MPLPDPAPNSPPGASAPGVPARSGAARHERPTDRGPTPAFIVLFTTVLLAVPTACDDNPFAIPWEADPTSVLLYSLARPELNLESAFNFERRIRVRIESAAATGQWDIALDTQDGQLVLLPPGALGINSRARIAPIPGVEFEELREAPADTMSYFADEPVPVEGDVVYVVRTRVVTGSFGQRCVYFAKLEPTSFDAERGTLTFSYVVNPNCNNRSLVPTDD